MSLGGRGRSFIDLRVGSLKCRDMQLLDKNCNLNVVGVGSLGEVTTKDITANGDAALNVVTTKKDKLSVVGDLVLRGPTYSSADEFTAIATTERVANVIVEPVQGDFNYATVRIEKCPCNGTLKGVNPMSGNVLYCPVEEGFDRPFVDLFQYSLEDVCGKRHLVTQFVCNRQSFTCSAAQVLFSYPPVERLYQCTTVNVSEEVAFDFNDDGEALAFRPDDGFLYRWAGFQDPNMFMGTIDRTTRAQGTNIFTGGPTVNSEFTSMVWYPPTNTFLGHDFGPTLWSINPNGTLAGSIGTTAPTFGTLRGMALVDGTRLFACDNGTPVIYEISPFTAAVIQTISLTMSDASSIFGANALATNPVTGRVFIAYRVSMSGSVPRQLGWVDVNTGVVTPVISSPIGVVIAAMCFDSEGKLWISSGNNGSPANTLLSLPAEPCPVTGPFPPITVQQSVESYLAWNSSFKLLARVSGSQPGVDQSLTYINPTTLSISPNLVVGSDYPEPSGGVPVTCVCQNPELEVIFNATTDGANAGHGLAWVPSEGLIYRTTGWRTGTGGLLFNSAAHVLQTIDPNDSSIRSVNLVPNGYGGSGATHDGNSVSGFLYYPPANQFFVIIGVQDGLQYTYLMSLNGTTTTFLGSPMVPGGDGAVRGLALVDGMKIYGVTTRGGNLVRINPMDGSYLEVIPMTLDDGRPVTGANALTTNPATGNVLITFRHPDFTGGTFLQFGIIDVTTGVIRHSECAASSQSFNAMVFDGNGKLWVTTGTQGDPQTFSLYSFPSEYCIVPPFTRINKISSIGYRSGTNGLLILDGPSRALLNMTTTAADSTFIQQLPTRNDVSGFAITEDGRVFAVVKGGSDLLEINPSDGSIISSVEMVLSGFGTPTSLSGAQAIAFNPITRHTIVAYSSLSGTGSLFGICDLDTGVVQESCVPETPSSIISMTFDDIDGQMWMNTGAGGSAPFSLLQLNREPGLADAPTPQPTQCGITPSFQVAPPYIAGSQLAYVPETRTMYYATGFEGSAPNNAMYPFNIDTLVVGPDIFPSGYPWISANRGQVRAMCWYPPWQQLLVSVDEQLWRVNTDGTGATFTGLDIAQPGPLGLQDHHGFAVVGSLIYAGSTFNPWVGEIDPTIPATLRRINCFDMNGPVLGITAMATRPFTSEVYVGWRSSTDGTNMPTRIGRLNLDTGEITEACVVRQLNFGSMEFDTQGRLWLGLGGRGNTPGPNGSVWRYEATPGIP